MIVEGKEKNSSPLLSTKQLFTHTLHAINRTMPSSYRQDVDFPLSTHNDSVGKT